MKARTLTSALLLASLASPAVASNFSYTALGIDVGRAKLDDNIYIADTRYSELGAAAIYGSYQFSSNIAIQLSSSALTNSGGNTEFTASAGALTLLLPFAVADSVDIVPHIGYVSVEDEACIGNSCMKYDDSALSYGIGMRVWAIKDRWELALGVADSELDNAESSVSLGSGYWFNRNNSVQLRYETASSLSVTTLGYRYSW